MVKVMLADYDLKHAIKSRRLVIDPIGKHTIQQNGVDLTVDASYAVQIGGCERVFLDNVQHVKNMYETRNALVCGHDALNPTGTKYIPVTTKQMVLLSTREKIKIPNDLMGICGVRSTVARLGLFSPNTYADAGFEGTLTIEVYNAGCNTVMIPVGSRFLHVAFAKIMNGVEFPYKGSYQGQIGVRPPKALKVEE